MTIERIIRVAKCFGLMAALAPIVSACGSMSDFSLKDQQWFARQTKLFNQSSIEAPPLTATRAITPDDLMSADGQCSGMVPPAAPADAQASTDGGPSPAVAPTGSVALGHTECDVARAIGSAPDNIQLSNDPGGERVALITYTHGPRPGAYTFKAGRLTMIDRVDVPEPVKPKPVAKPKKKKPA